MADLLVSASLAGINPSPNRRLACPNFPSTGIRSISSLNCSLTRKEIISYLLFGNFLRWRVSIIREFAHRAQIRTLRSFCIATQLHILYHLLLKFKLHIVLLLFCCGDAEYVLL